MTEFLAANWIWLVAIGLFLVMHRSHGGCGMHGHNDHSHDHSRHQDHQSVPQDRRPDDRTST